MWRKKKASRKNCKGRYASNNGCLSSSPTTTTTTKNMDNIFLAADRVLHKYVIRDSEHTERGWEFRNLFVLEATTFNICITVMFVSFWVINRQTHIRPTKGSKITRRQQRRQEKESHFDSHYDNHNDDHDDDTGEETDEFDDEDRDDEQDDGDDNSISIEVDDDGFTREQGAVAEADSVASTQDAGVLDVAVGWRNYAAFERLLVQRISGRLERA